MKLTRVCFYMSILALLVGCSVPVRGTASFTLLTDQNEAVAKNYKAVDGEIKKDMCQYVGPLFLFWWGDIPLHETLVANALQEYKADAFTNAELETSQVFIPYIFMKNCVSIKGTPVVLLEGK